MATKKATYQYDNGSGWDEIMFKTTADQVVESSSKRFVSDSEKSTWNGKANSNHTHTSLLSTGLSGQTVSLNSYTLSSGSPQIAYYYCPTDGGGSNITGRPDDNNKNAFYLRVELIRYASSSDYITKQTYIRGNEKIMYVRYCTNGTWSAWEKVYTSTNKPTASEIGAASSSHTHNYAGSSSTGGAATTALACSGNSATATKLATSRTINGTSFDGSANITTANWGTARTLTIGNSGKSVNGSGNVSWSLSEIGAAPTSHTHSYLPLSGGTVTGRTIFSQGINIVNVNGGSGTTGYMHVAQIKISGNYQNQPLIFDISQRERFGSIIVKFASAGNTDPALGYIYVTGSVVAYIYKSATSTWDLYIQKSEAYDSIDVIDFKKGDYMSSTTITWKSTTVTSLPSGYVQASTAPLATAGNSATATKLQNSRTINGTSFDGSANITTANWGTARTLTIGNSGKSVNGSANVSWTLSEIGAAASSHTHNYAGSSSAGGSANTAVKLATARTINGTSFDGSTNITTANWGTTRTLTIGNTGKSVNGSGNVSWSLSEIGAASSSHTHSYLPLSGGTMTGDLKMNDAGIVFSSVSLNKASSPNTLQLNGVTTPNQAVVKFGNGARIYSGNGEARLMVEGGIYSNGAITGASDERLKENIKYFNDSVMLLNESNEKSISDITLSKDDFYNFMKDEINFASFDYKGCKIENLETNLGFIAQEIADTKVGSKIIIKPKNEEVTEDETERVNSCYQYSLMNYVTTIGIALQKAIEKIDNLETEIALLKESK